MAKSTAYIVKFRRSGEAWQIDEGPVLYPSMTEAEMAALSEYPGLETKVAPVVMTDMPMRTMKWNS